MRKLAFFTVCASFSLFAAEEDTVQLAERLEAAKLDSKRFKSALLHAQKSNREQVEKISHELSKANAKRMQLEREIELIRQESVQHASSLKSELEQMEHKVSSLNEELTYTRQKSQDSISKLTAELMTARQNTADLKDELLKARKGNSTQVQSLENELKQSHAHLQKLRTELADAKSVNAKQLKDFTAWLYNAKNEIENLQGRLVADEQKYVDQIALLQAEVAKAHQSSDYLSQQLAKAEYQYKEELIEVQEQLFIAQAQNQQYQQTMQQQQMQSQVCQPCVEPSPIIFCWRPDTEQPTSWARGEFLMWTAEAGDLDYAIRNFPVPQSSDVGQIGEVEESKFGWNPGFRVALGHRFRPDFWELEAVYTYVNIDGSTKVSDPAASNRVVAPTLPSVSAQDTILASSCVNLYYSVFDLKLARSFLPSKRLIIRPQVGLTGAWIDRDFNVTYSGNGFPANKVKNRLEYEFSGGGMRVGLDADWYLGSGFSLFSKASLAAVLGYYKNTTETSTNNATTVNPPANIEDSRYDDNRIVTHIQVQLGPAYGKVWNDMGILLFAGYELNAWYNVEEVRTATTLSSSSMAARRTLINDSTLGLHGFVGKIQVNF